ncbi:hypothetical protein [Streptomyces sp. NPDC057694]|uniref:hypothetical protein n=1 Tax=Streptomyces sp. NPDC057694 TaxID=3346216 RepID=UPI0036ADFDFD
MSAQAAGLRAAFGPFTRACDVMIVDGGHSVAAAVEEVFKRSREVYMCLLSASADASAGTIYEVAIRAYWDAVNALVWAMHREAAQGA